MTTQTVVAELRRNQLSDDLSWLRVVNVDELDELMATIQWAERLGVDPQGANIGEATVCVCSTSWRDSNPAYGLELLSSLHWAGTHDDRAAADPEFAAEQVAAWTERKRRLMGADHVNGAWNHLRSQGWLPVDVPCGR